MMGPTHSGGIDVQAELDRRHKAAVLLILSMLAMTVVLSLIAFLCRNVFHHRNNSSLDIILKVTILTFGLGSVVLRRTRFAAMRLKGIAALKGASGLLGTLCTTTIQVALLGAVISLLGFITTVATGDPFYTYRSGLVGLFVLLYSYPTKSSWHRALQKFVTLGPESQRLNPSQPID